MRVVCEFGIKNDLCIGARVFVRDNGKWSTARGKRICERWEEIVKHALGVWNTDEEFRTEFSFYLEPHTVEGPLMECVGTMWADFKRHNCCHPQVADSGYKIYQTILNATARKIDGGNETK